MNGLWVCIVTKDHPKAYDPALGEPIKGMRWRVGDVITAHEGERDKVPPLGVEDGIGARSYRWQFYADKTVADLCDYLPMGKEKTLDELKGGVRLKSDNDPIIRAGTDLNYDVKVFNDKAR